MNKSTRVYRHHTPLPWQTDQHRSDEMLQTLFSDTVSAVAAAIDCLTPITNNIDLVVPSTKISPSRGEPAISTL